MATIKNLGEDYDPPQDGPYKITFSKNIAGRRERWYWTRDTEDDALIVAADAIRDARAGRDPYERYEVTRVGPRGLTVAQWAPVWLAAQDHAPNTRVVVENAINHNVIPVFGHLELTAVTHIAVKGWLTRLKREKRPRTKKPPSPYTVARIWGAFAAMMRDAALEGLIDRDPCAGLKAPPGRRRKNARHALTPKQVVALAAELARVEPDGEGKLPAPTAVQLRYQRMTLALAWTGCRWSELAGLRRNPAEVQMMRRLAPAIVVVEPIKSTGRKGGRYHGEPKSEAGKRAVELIKPVSDLLALHMAHGHEYVFATIRGTVSHHGDYWAAFKAAATKLGHKEWTPHDLRHSHATWLKGCDRRAVQERLGHEPEDVTDGYTHVEAADRVEILRVLGELWDQAHGAAPQAAAQ